VPGQEAGNSITDVLYGDWNPSGRLPYTIAKQQQDYSAQLVLGGGPSDILSIPYTEGYARRSGQYHLKSKTDKSMLRLNVDYRHFDTFNITPRFEFGYGLSYTNFTYSKLHIAKVGNQASTDPKLEASWAAGNATPIAAGSSTALWYARPLSSNSRRTFTHYPPRLHRPLYNVTFEVKNTGPVWGGDVCVCSAWDVDGTDMPYSRFLNFI
jgi:beta-glucosidase